VIASDETCNVVNVIVNARNTVELSRNGSRGSSYFSSTVVVEHFVVGVVNIIHQ
jgi:hypothetical protein